MYMVEVVELTKAALASQSWARKAQGAQAMKTLATKLGDSGTLTAPHLGLLLEALLNGLPGRIWVGKVLHSLSHSPYYAFINMILYVLSPLTILSVLLSGLERKILVGKILSDNA
jgi:hypothetical protein